MNTQEAMSWLANLFNVDEKDIVPSGVAELAKLQQQGYMYIKP